MDIEVVQAAPNSIEVVNGPATVVTQVTPSQQVSVGIALPQQNLFISNTKPAFSGPGLWIETGLGTSGRDYTIWVEDGLG